MLLDLDMYLNAHMFFAVFLQNPSSNCKSVEGAYMF